MVLRADDFFARLERIGVKCEVIFVRVNGEEVPMRYLQRDGKCTPIDLGDIQRLTPRTIDRICRDLEISKEALTGLLN